MNKNLGRNPITGKMHGVHGFKCGISGKFCRER